MIKKELLIKLQEQAKRGCVSFGYGEDGRKYYSVNGSTDKIKHRNIIEDIIGDSPIFCGVNYAFTILEPFVPDSIFLMIDPFYDALKFTPKILGFRKRKEKLYFAPQLPSGYDNRYFTCAEKKLIEYAEQKKINLILMYSSKEPCYHCLPTINSVYFLRNNEIKEIKRESYSVIWANEIACKFEMK